MRPKILHFVWIGGELPTYATDNIKLFVDLNPDYRVRIHDESTELHPKLVSQWNDDLDPAQKSDLIRYSVLYREGGWYFDCDFFPFRPLSVADTGWLHDRCLISEQAGHNSGRTAPYANAPLACEANDTGMALIIEEASKAVNKERCSFGPLVIKKVVEANPHQFNVIDAGWFFPLAISDIKTCYPLLVNREHRRMSLSSSGSGGQWPIAAHLWASAGVIPDRCAAVKKIALVQAQIREQCLDSLSEGLVACGYEVVRANNAVKAGKVLPSLVVCWNGMREASWSKMALDNNIPILYAEYGFFNRGWHNQFDTKGILHHASWANDFVTSDEGKKALATHCTPAPVRARTSGDILILGQLTGDTQLIGAPLPGPAPLCRQVSRSLPVGLNATFRSHPLDAQSARLRHPNIINQVDGATIAANRDDYSKTKKSSSLADALASARFCIAINSNALVEATCAGVPCLAFGPSLGINAGVYRKATLATLPDDILAMLHGWEPEGEKVDAYLQTLAVKQHSHIDLRTKSTVTKLLSQLGIQHD